MVVADSVEVLEADSVGHCLEDDVLVLLSRVEDQSEGLCVVVSLE